MLGGGLCDVSTAQTSVLFTASVLSRNESVHVTRHTCESVFGVAGGGIGLEGGGESFQLAQFVFGTQRYGGVGLGRRAPAEPDCANGNKLGCWSNLNGSRVMESPGTGPGQGSGLGSGSGEKPSKAAECLSELNRIIEAQHELLERQKARIAELELQVAELRSRNARVHEEYERHLRTCTLHQHHQHQQQHNNSHSISTPSALTAIQEK